MTKRMPAFFVSHGSPMLALDPGETGTFWEKLGRDLPRPKAVLCVSAHWMTRGPAASLAAKPETIHDFYGFPAPLYAIQYPAPGAPELAQRAAALLKAAGIPAALDPDYGLDHGAWVPLRSIYARADMPVTQFAIQPERDARWHFRLGEALRPLREESVLILASGGAVHNLGAIVRQGGPAPEWAQRFDGWLADATARGDTETLLDWETAAPFPHEAHPTPDHFLPFFVAAGTAGKGASGIRVHDGFTIGSMSMAAFRFDG